MEDGRNLLFPDLLDEATGSEQPAAVSPSSSVLREILHTVTASSRYEGFAPRVAAFLDFDLDRTRSLLRTAADAGAPGWRREIVDGALVLDFDGGPRRSAAHCGLVRVEPGVYFPRHHHRGDEWSFVLSGSAREDTGRVWNPGDIVRNAKGTRHSFEILGADPFVFIVVLDDWIDVEA